MKRLLPVLLLVGCIPPVNFILEDASSGTLLGPGGRVTLDAEDLARLRVILSEQPGRKTKVTSIPDYILDWEADDVGYTVSFFVEESLVYPAAYISAWSAEVAGEAVIGAELDDDLVERLEYMIATGSL